MLSGTLRLLVMMPMDGDFLDMAHALSWADFPPTAGWGGPRVEDVDLGDTEGKGLPTVPEEPGLWLLRWPWETCQDEDGFDDARYADTCEWSRPTIADLVALGALPDRRATEGP